MAENRKPQQFMQFVADLVGSLDPVEVARTTVTYARDLVGCERCSLLSYKNEEWKVIAMSGQENVESRSVAVKSLTSFVAANAKPATKILRRDDLTPAALALAQGETTLAPNPASATAGSAEYFQDTQMASAAIIPLLDVRKEIIGALFCESVLDNFFGQPQPEGPAAQGRQVAEWISKHSSRALVAADDYHSLPLLAQMQRARDLHKAWSGRGRNRFLAKAGAIALIGATVLSWPATVKVEGNCLLRPERRAMVVPQSPGQLDQILVAEGDKVQKGQVLAKIDARRLQSDLEINTQDKLRYQSEVERYRSAGDEASAQIALIQKRIAEEKEKRLKQEIEASSLRAPMDGVVLTKDLDLRLGDYLQAGMPLIEVASLDKWELMIDVRESDIGFLDLALKNQQTVPVNFILYARSAVVLHGEIKSRQQISATANPESAESIFTVTIPSPEIPAAMTGQLRPGLTGRAKIDISRRPFAYVLTRKFIHWLRMRWVV